MLQPSDAYCFHNNFPHLSSQAVTHCQWNGSNCLRIYVHWGELVGTGWSRTIGQLDLFERKQRKYALMTILAAPTKLCPLVPIATLWSNVCLQDIVQLLYHAATHLHNFNPNMQEFFYRSGTILVYFFCHCHVVVKRMSARHCLAALPCWSLAWFSPKYARVL